MSWKNIKKVLIISYHFPPDAEVGGLRVQKFSKYLPTYGWEPYVLSVKEKYYGRIDRGRCEDINTRVFRTHMVYSLRDLYLKIGKFPRFRNGDKKGVSEENKDVIKEGHLELKQRKMTNIKKMMLSFLWLPDDRTGWLIPGIMKGILLIKNFRINTIITTSPPHSVQLIGLFLKKIMNRRWIVDFRDPWTVDLEKERSLSSRMHIWLERKVVKNADMVIAATEVVRSWLIKKFNDMPERKFICITNGYDAEDFRNASKFKLMEKKIFRISYLGEFYAGRTPEIFLRAIRDLAQEGDISLSKIGMTFLGKVEHIGKTKLEDIVREMGLSDITRIGDSVPYTEAVNIMVNSAVLLVFSPQPFYQPTKVFEYMASGAYIIAFTPQGALAEAVARYPKGFVVAYGDLAGAKEAIMKCYKGFMEMGSIEGNGEIDHFDRIKEYDRKYLTEKLSKIL